VKKNKKLNNEFIIDEFIDRVFLFLNWYDEYILRHGFLKKNKNLIIKKLSRKIRDDVASLYGAVLRDFFSEI